MLHRRIYQFLIVYFLGLAFLLLTKYVLNLSDYVIPSPQEIWHTGNRVFGRYLFNVMDTLSVAIIGHILSIGMATVKYHLTNIFSKLQAKNRVEAVTIALEHKLVEQHK